MAYAALVSLESVINQVHRHNIQAGDVSFAVHKVNLELSILSNHEYRYIRIFREEEMKSLHDNINVLLQHLEKFPKKCVSLESRIRDLARHLEDIIESFMSGPPHYIFQSDDYGKEVHWAQMISAFDCYTQNLNWIVKETPKIMETDSDHPDDMWIDEYLAGTSSSGTSSSGKGTIVGLNEDLDKILDRASGHDRALQFIPIVGMGGIGKTTLARNVFDHPSIVQRFDIRCWVTVSQDYSLRDILLGLLSADKGNQEDDESLIESLKKKLTCRRFLVVLDDMWHGEVWDKIMRAFPEDYKGSRIIITTRLTQVAAGMDSSSSIHQMQLLNQGQSWSLMCEKVYGKDSRCPPRLENIGTKIAMKCKGLPLAIIVIAGLLKGNHSQDYWEEIARNVSETASYNDQLDRILSLSYDDLPHHMRACFLYMGVFPEDYRIKPELIIRLWVAEGFVKPKGGKSMETVAKECFEDLVRRNLVLGEMSHEIWGIYYYFRMHDILRELCLKKAAEEYFFVHCKGGFINEISLLKIAKGQRRIIFDRSVEVELLPNHRYNLPLHSSICLSAIPNKSSSLVMLFSTQFMLLRILHKLYLTRAYIHLMTSDDSILFKLIHLRLLSIQSDSSIGPNKIHISTSLVQLQHLQALELDCRSSIILPWNIWRMPELRHLIASDYYYGMEFSDLHCCSGTLEFMQTLSKVRNFKFINDAVKRFPNLKTLKLEYCVSCDDGWAEYCLNNLVHLHQLEDLNVSNLNLAWVPLPTNLAFPNSIKRLTLRKLKISGEMMSKMSSLLNLEFLQLKECLFKCELFEEFPKLKFLMISNLKWKLWIIEETNFPCLEELSLEYCDSVEIPVSICDDIPSLEKLVVNDCYGKTFESAKRIQDEQLSNGYSTCQIIIHDGGPGPGSWRSRSINSLHDLILG